MGNSGLKQHYQTASKTGVLKISEHKLKEIPPQVFGLCGVLRILDFSINRLHIVPKDISRFNLLKQLNLSNNKIEILPESLGSLEKLEMLNVSHNILLRLPLSVSKLKNLKQIYLDSNKLSEFPLELIGLIHLEVVTLSHNKITTIPCGMSDFHATELNLNQNQVSSISHDLHMAPKLKILRLEENCLNINAINITLLRDSKIHTLVLDGNLFDSKALMSLEGYNEYMERFTAVKKKMF